MVLFYVWVVYIFNFQILIKLLERKIWNLGFSQQDEYKTVDFIWLIKLFIYYFERDKLIYQSRVDSTCDHYKWVVKGWERPGLIVYLE